MDSNYYRDNAMQLLKDKENYKEIEECNDDKVIKIIKKLIREYKVEVTVTEKDCVCSFNTKTLTSDGLPRIHKSRDIQKKQWIRNHNMLK